MPIGAIGGNAERNRDHNQKVVLEYVRANEPAGRAEIAKSCSLSIQAVSNITAVLEEQGLLKPDGHRTGVRGKPALQYRFNPDGACAVGVELRPDAIVATLMNLSGEVAFSKHQFIDSAHPEIAVPLIVDLVEEAIAVTKRPKSTLLGVGIVMPGPFGETALTSAGEAVLPGWSEINTQQVFQDALGYPVLIENDATAAAVSERVAGIAKGLNNFCFIYFGTGIGLGVVSKGHAQRGAFGNAGEIGHIITQAGGNLCACGNKGCLETYASRFAAKQHMKQFGINLETGRDFAQVLKDQDPNMLNWMQNASAHLSQVIGIVENLYDPQTVILGGALPDILIDSLIEHLELPVGSVSNRDDREIARVIRGFSGRETAAIGAAAMIIHQTITPSNLTLA
ncbi:ROK family protein [Maritalea sp.]|uniref:ROK family protein n=1 Tax=Maritalea sp. TaxID=2003361 RepID=UPI003EFA6E6C